MEPYGRAEIAEDYRALLSLCDGDKARARRCLEAYLAGRNGMMPQGPTPNRPPGQERKR